MMTNTEELKRLDDILRDPLNGLIWENRIMAADAVAEVIALRDEVERLRRLDAEYGRVEVAIIMGDPDFDGDSDHANCGDRMIESVERLQARANAAEADVAALGNVLWMADEWFEHGGSETMMSDEYRDDLMKASAALAAHTQRVNEKEGV